MNEEIKVSMRRSATDLSSHFIATIQDTLSESTAYSVMRLVAEKIADRYVEEHYSEIVAKFDQQAIANLAVADSGKKIAEEIRSKPTVIHETNQRTEIYQRGLLGGIRRVR